MLAILTRLFLIGLFVMAMVPELQTRARAGEMDRGCPEGRPEILPMALKHRAQIMETIEAPSQHAALLCPAVPDVLGMTLLVQMFEDPTSTPMPRSRLHVLSSLQC